MSEAKSSRVACTCQHCGKSFESFPSDLCRGGGKFCSQRCYRADSAPVGCDCQHCGKSFEAFPSALRRGYGKFCSQRCYRDHKNSVPLRERFSRYLSPPTATGCILWTGCKNSMGYGQIGFCDKCVYAHRVAWELTNGSIPDGMFVCHRCDTPACVNHEHMFLGTHDDNMADMRSKGRNAMGEHHNFAKLTVDDVLEIRRLYATGQFTQVAISNMFGMTFSNISQIVRRRTWKHVT